MSGARTRTAVATLQVGPTRVRVYSTHLGTIAGTVVAPHGVSDHQPVWAVGLLPQRAWRSAPKQS